LPDRCDRRHGLGAAESNEHARFPGTLTLAADTLIRVWSELGECVAATGVRKLLPDLS